MCALNEETSCSTGIRLGSCVRQYDFSELCNTFSPRCSKPLNFATNKVQKFVDYKHIYYSDLPECFTLLMDVILTEQYPKDFHEVS